MIGVNTVVFYNRKEHNMKKRAICLLMTLFMLLSISTGSFAAGDKELLSNDIRASSAEIALDYLEKEYRVLYEGKAEYEIAKKYTDIYRADPMFHLHYQNTPENAITMVTSLIDRSIKRDPGSNTEQTERRAAVYSVSGVPYHQQVRTNSCGAASALQVIVQQGGEDNITGSTYDEKEETLISETQLGAGKETSVIVYEVVNLINKYSSSDSEFYYIACDNLTETEFKEYVSDSFIKGCPVILHAIKGYLDYYPASDMGGHYVVGFKWRPPEDIFTVNDCNWRDEYTGVHETSMTSAYESVHEYSKTRYLICAK